MIKVVRSFVMQDLRRQKSLQENHMFDGNVIRDEVLIVKVQ